MKKKWPIHQIHIMYRIEKVKKEEERDRKEQSHEEREESQREKEEDSGREKATATPL